MMLPELTSPCEFHTWLRDQVDADITPSQILAELEQMPGDLSLCRQMNIAHIFGLKALRDARTEDCLQSRDIRVESFAIGLSAYRMMVSTDTTNMSYNTSAVDLLPMLQGALRDLRSSARDTFAREVEGILRVAIGVAQAYRMEHALAGEEASRALFCLSSVGAVFYISRAKSLLIAIFTEEGKLSDTLALLEEEKKNPNRPPNKKLYQEHAYAYTLYSLGQNDLPLNILTEAPQFDQDSSIAHQVQQQKALRGIANLEEETVQGHPSSSPDTWITDSMRYLARAAALARTNQNLKLRSTLLKQAVDATAVSRYDELTRTKALRRWIIGVANLWQGRPTSAADLFQDLSLTGTQWFDSRLLASGLELDISLHLNYPELSPNRPLEELRELFEDARQLPFASAEGLAERLIHWHPLAAAFAALVPNPIIELKEATNAILRVGATNSVYDVPLPPAYAAELSLRALDFDLQSRKFVQADMGPNRGKRNKLFVNYGEAKYWRPSLSAASIVYGLVKAGHATQAQAVFHEYGVVPQSNAEYVMLPAAEHVGKATLQLLVGSLSARQFTELVLIDS